MVTVQASDDGGGFPGHIQQNGRRRSSVHGAIVNARQQNDRAGGLFAVGQRDEKRHAARRPDARQYADESPNQASDKSIEQVDRSQSDLEAVPQVIQDFDHDVRLLHQLSNPPQRQRDVQNACEEPEDPQAEGQWND